MKHCFIATLMLLCLGTISATAQISQADTMSIEAISDTTNVIEETLDSAYGGGYYSIPDIFGTDLETLPFKMILPLIIVGLIFLFLPLVVLLLLLYLIYRNSKQKTELMDAMIKSGKPIPNSMLPTTLQPRELLWRKGIMKVSIGLGIAVFFWILGAEVLSGVALIVAFYGAGQMVMAKTSVDGNDGFADKNAEHIYED